MTLKSLGEIFVLREVFPICQQITVFNLFSAIFNLIGNLLVLSQFACKLNLINQSRSSYINPTYINIFNEVLSQPHDLATLQCVYHDVQTRH